MQEARNTIQDFKRRIIKNREILWNVCIYDPLHKYLLNMNENMFTIQKWTLISKEPKITFDYHNLFENIEMWDKFSSGLFENKTRPRFYKWISWEREINKIFPIGILPTKRVTRTSEWTRSRILLESCSALP